MTNDRVRPQLASPELASAQGGRTLENLGRQIGGLRALVSVIVLLDVLLQLAETKCRGVRREFRAVRDMKVGFGAIVEQGAGYQFASTWVLVDDWGRGADHSGDLFHLRPRLPLPQLASNSALAASSVATRLSVRRSSGLMGKCRAQNQV